MKRMIVVGSLVAVGFLACAQKQEVKSPPNVETNVCTPDHCPVEKHPTSGTVKVESAFSVSSEKPACPNDMVFVSGEYCSKPNHDLPQYDQTGTGDPTCEKWKEKPCNKGGTLPSCKFARCLKYKPSSQICLGKQSHKAFCIDRDEGGSDGVSTPIHDVNYYQAVAECSKRGKRLCNESEWIFSCEGPNNNPYSTGLDRPDGVCNLDIEKGLAKGSELADLGKPSSSFPACMSWAGVREMTGNYDELTVRDVSPAPSSSKEMGSHHNALHSGWWGPIRGRCIPATTGHDDYFHETQISFRCCSNPNQ